MLLRVLSATSLLAALTVPATAVTENWKYFYQEGVKADDYADYKKAEALLEQACTLAQAEPKAEPQAVACRALARTYAIDEQYAEAESALTALVARLRQENGPKSLVDALFDLADLLDSVGRYEQGTECLREAAGYFPQLTAVERVRALASIGEMYLAVENYQLGMELIYRAQAELLMDRNLEDAETVATFADLAYALTINNQPKKAIALLEPVVAAIDQRASEADEIKAEAHSAYRRVIHQLATSYGKSGKRKIEKQFRAKANAWPRKKQEAPGGAIRIGRGVKAPRLLAKREPSYTKGAENAGAQGKAVLRVEVWPDGRVHHVQVVHRLPHGLTLRAIEAVRKWRFRPGMRDGKPVKVEATIEVNFRLI